MALFYYIEKNFPEEFKFKVNFEEDKDPVLMVKAGKNTPANSALSHVVEKGSCLLKSISPSSWTHG